MSDLEVKQDRSVYKDYLQILLSNRKQVWSELMVVTSRVLTGQVMVLFVAAIGDKIQMGNINIGQDLLLYVGGYSLIALAVIALERYGLQYSYQALGRITPDLFANGFERVLNLPHLDVHKYHSGELASRINNFARNYEQFVATVSSILYMALNVLVTGVVIYLRDWRLAFAYVLVLVPSIIGFAYLTEKRVAVNNRQAWADDKLRSELQDGTSHIDEIRMSGVRAQFLRDFHAQATELYRYTTNRRLAAVNLGSVRKFVILTMRGIFLGLSLFLVAKGEMTLGTFVLLQIYVDWLVGMMPQMSGVFRHLFEYLESGSRIKNLSNSSALAEPTKPKSLPAVEKIEFADVSYHYPDSQRLVLDNCNLAIKKGQMVGLVGASGAGKSTIASLLLRLFDPTDGEVLINGVSLKDYGSKNVQQQVTFISQESHIFNKSLRDNLIIGQKNITAKRLQEVCTLAQLNEVVDKLPEGLDTVLGERGFKLSGGEKQRIAIARAFLRDRPIIIFDEPTSALDSRNEKLVQKSMDQLFKGRLGIVIAHRLSTIRHLRKILVLESGKIVEEGRHDELITQNGPYANLWSLQG